VSPVAKASLFKSHPVLTRPRSMDNEAYVGGVEPLHGPDAWNLFQASADGDVSRVRTLLRGDPRLVNAQYWYQFPIHMAVRQNRPDVVRLLLENGADPGQSRYTYNSWDKLLVTARERGFEEIGELLVGEMATRFSYDDKFVDLADSMRAEDMVKIDSLLGAAPELIGKADALGNNPLHLAAIRRNVDLIECFFALGADLEACRADGRRPIHVAIDGDYWSRPGDLPKKAIQDPWVVVNYLLDLGAELDLGLHCMMGDVEQVAIILAADPTAGDRLDSARTSPLYRAARAGQMKVVDLLLSYGADPARPEDLAPSGRALHEAVSRNDLGMAELLLAHGADPTADVDSSGDCFFIVGFSHPKDGRRMRQLLMDYGARQTLDLSRDEMKELLESGVALREEAIAQIFRSNDEELLDAFLRSRGTVVAKMVPGDIWGGENLPSPPVLQRFLHCGLDVRRANWIGRTFLHVAAEKGSVELATALLAAGAELEAVELETGATPLGVAVSAEHTKMVAFLLERGADPDRPAGMTWATARTRAYQLKDPSVRENFESWDGPGSG